MSRHSDVTAVIPCFNHGRYLGEAVASALAQEGGAPEVIVVDDGSDDAATEAAIAALPREAKVIRQRNAGPAAARNAGIERSRTPLFVLLDADDRLPPDALENLRAPLDAYPELGHTYGTMRLFGEWSGEVAFTEYDPYRLLHRSIIGGLGLVRRRVWEDVGGFDPSLGGNEDWDFFLGALEAGWRGRRVPHVTLEYRKHERSGQARDRDRYRELYRALRRKHAGLFARRGELAKESDMGPIGRLIYRTYWAWRPIPPRLERAAYGLVFRRREGES